VKLLSSLIVAVALGSLVACGGEKAPPNALEGLSAEEILTRSRAAVVDARAFKLGVAAVVSGSVGNSLPAVIRDALTGGITVDGAGPVNGANATFDFEASLGGLPGFQGNLTSVDGQVFLGLLGTDYRLDIPKERVQTIRPAVLPRGALGWIAEPTLAGQEKIDGREYAVLEGTLDLDKAGANLLAGLAVLQGRSLPPAQTRQAIAQLRAGLTEQSVRVFVDVETLRPGRIEAKLDFSGRLDAFPDLSAAKLDLTLNISDYGDAATITAPSTNEVLDLERARSLLGG
jgi:hypothetical protein